METTTQGWILVALAVITMEGNRRVARRIETTPWRTNDPVETRDVERMRRICSANPWACTIIVTFWWVAWGMASNGTGAGLTWAWTATQIVAWSLMAMTTSAVVLTAIACAIRRSLR